MAYLAANLLNTLFLDKPTAELSEFTTYNQPIARFDVTSSQESTDSTSTTSTSTSTTTPSTSSTTSTSSTSSSSSTDSITTSARTNSSTSSTKTVTSAPGSTPQTTTTFTTGPPTTSNGGNSSQSQSPPGQSEPASSPHSTSPIPSGPPDTSFSPPSISPTDTSSMTGMISVPTSSSITNEGAGDSQPGFGGSSSRAKLPVILGTVLGGSVLFIIFVSLVFLRQRRRRSRQIAALRWEPAHDPHDDDDDSVAHSTMSSELLISGVIHNIRDNFRLQALDTVQEVPEAESRPVSTSKSLSPARSPSHYDMSSISSTSTITFARPPILSADDPPTPNRNSSAGFYQPSALEDGRLSPRSDDLWLNRPRQTRHSMMTVVPEN